MREHEPPPFYKWFGKESKDNRKRLTRLRRRQTKLAVGDGRYDDADLTDKGTEGWMTH